MLDGITVLETISEPSVSSGGVAWIAIMCVVFVVIFVVNFVSAIKTKEYHGIVGDETIGITFAIVCDIVAVVAIIFGCSHVCKQTNIINATYRVSIDESVSLVEFNEKYEIVQRDGDEYIIKEINVAK